MGDAVTRERATAELLRALGAVGKVEFREGSWRLIAFAEEPSKGKVLLTRVASVLLEGEKGKRRFSAAARRKMSEAAKARWAKKAGQSAA